MTILGIEPVTATFLPKRAIIPFNAQGPITATATIEEHHHDEITITEHPVEQGAAIADHAYKNPAQVVVDMAWSESDAAAAGSTNYLQDIYNQLLQLQAALVPFDLFTGRRAYQNMLVKSLTTRTDRRTAHVLRVLVICREVILVATTDTLATAEMSQQAEPEQTASPQDTGTRQTSSVNEDAVAPAVLEDLGIGS